MQRAQGALFSRDWLQLAWTAWIAAEGTVASNFCLVVMFMQPWEIHSVLRPQEERISRLGSNSLMKDWKEVQQDSEALSGGTKRLLRRR